MNAFGVRAEAEVEAGVEAGVEADVEAELEPAVRAVIEADVEPVVRAESGVEPEVKSGAQARVEPSVEPGVELGIKLGIKPGVETGIELGVETGVEAGTGVESAAQAVVEVEVEVGAETGAKPAFAVEVPEALTAGFRGGGVTAPETMDAKRKSGDPFVFQTERAGVLPLAVLSLDSRSESSKDASAGERNGSIPPGRTSSRSALGMRLRGAPEWASHQIIVSIVPQRVIMPLARPARIPARG